MRHERNCGPQLCPPWCPRCPGLMFTVEAERDGACVSLGIPCGPVGGPSPPRTNPYSCKAGGAPAWLLPSSAPRATCAGCGAPQALAAQLYAPVPGFDRTLYIMGCNNAACPAPLDKRWRVLRQQCPAVTSAGPPALPCTATDRVVADDVSAANWGDCGGGGCGGGWAAGDGGEWGATARAACSATDIERLLAQREAVSTNAGPSSTAGPLTPVRVPTGVPIVPTMSPPPVGLFMPTPSADLIHTHQETVLKIIPEPWEADDDLSHERALLAAYRGREAGDEVIRTGDVEAANEGANTGAAAGPSSAGHYGGVASTGGQGEQYEATPPGTSLFLRFAKRLQRSPHQCVRYAYGGEPLWPVQPPLDFDTPPPRCPGCGAARVFELQLMPSLLAVLGVDGTTGNGSVDAAGDEKDVVGGWAVLAVYSCDHSCGESCEEYIRVINAM